MYSEPRGRGQSVEVGGELTWNGPANGCVAAEVFQLRELDRCQPLVLLDKHPVVVPSPLECLHDVPLGVLESQTVELRVDVDPYDVIRVAGRDGRNKLRRAGGGERGGDV